MNTHCSSVAAGIAAGLIALLPAVALGQPQRRPPKAATPAAAAPSQPSAPAPVVTRAENGGGDQQPRARPRARNPERAQPAAPSGSGSGSSDRARTAERRREPVSAPARDASEPTARSPRGDSSAAARRYPVDGERGRVAVPRSSRPPTAIPGWGWYDRGYYGSSYWYRNYYRPSRWYWSPWGFGLGYWSYYDPWYASYGPYGYGGGYGYGGYGYNVGQRYEEGSIRLKFKPREAQVFVDGYYVGVVDEYDGTFQSLRLEEGPHRLEIRLEGFLPQTYDVYIIRDRKITLQGDLQRGLP